MPGSNALHQVHICTFQFLINYFVSRKCTVQFFCPFETPLKGSRETLKTSCVVPQNTLILPGSFPLTLRYIHFLYIYVHKVYLPLQTPRSGFCQHLVFKTLRHCTEKGNMQRTKNYKNLIFNLFLCGVAKDGWNKFVSCRWYNQYQFSVVICLGGYSFFLVTQYQYYMLYNICFVNHRLPVHGGLTHTNSSFVISLVNTNSAFHFWA